jgi:adenylate cyclase class 2
MHIEYEATFFPVDKDMVRKRLSVAGASLIRKEYLQKRVNFNLPKESPYFSTGWMRVRDEGGKITMSIKAIESNATMEGQKEICLSVENFEEARGFALTLGLREKAYQESKRELWTLDGVEICIDEWPWLEPFVEIEGSSESEVRVIAETLAFSWSEAYFGAVDGLYEKRYGVSKVTINNEMPRFVFDDVCPFSKL